MDEETALTICEENGYLNEKGLTQLLKYAKKQIIKYDEQISNVCKYKGLITKDEKVIE